LLIYDHNKRFVGIDDEDLRLLGFSTTQELLSACEDIADLFVKKPGYVHNFKNFQWIDFVLHSEAENAKAIINSGKKSFSCDIVIKPFHMLDAAGQEAYSIRLQHIKPLSGSESAEVHAAAAAAPQAPTPPVEPEPVIPAAPVVEEVPEMPELPQDDLPRFDDIPSTTLDEPAAAPVEEDIYKEDPYDLPEDIYPDFNKPLEIEDDIYMDASTSAPEVSEPVAEVPEITPEPELVAEPEPKERPMLGDYIAPEEQGYADQMKNFEDYVYDPHIAADELGLPVDLIEEFIGDFIGQAHEFHDELMEAAAKSDFDNVKLLSHKLKGVAANLRIEDSFEMLSVINNSHDAAEVEAFLKMFYRTIAKLEGKELPDFNAAPAPAPEPEAVAPVVEEAVPEPMDEDVSLPPMPEPSADEDIYSLDIKETAAAREAPIAETAPESDDLYDLNVAPEPLIPETETLEPAFQVPEAAPVEEDLYTLESAPEPIEPTEEATAPEAATAEDLYEFENVVPETEAPFEPEPLEEAPSIPEPALTDTEETPVETAVPDLPEMNYDATSAANELGLPKDVVNELIEDFTDHAESAKTLIEDAIDSGNAAGWSQQALEMKGIADNLRMTDIASTLKTLEAADDPLTAKTATDELYGLIKQL
jgi:HPt (histidine-containing phosphotransfer) domain-containing protein